MSSSSFGVLDINTTSVDGAIIEVFRDAVNICPKIISSSTNTLEIPDNLDPTRFLEHTLENIKNAMEALVRDPNGPGVKGMPSTWVCFLAAPFYVSQSRLIKTEKEKSFTVSEKMIKDIVAGEMAKFKGAGHDIFPGVTSDDHEIINSSVMEIKLNGYDDLKNIYQKNVNTLDLSLYLSASATDILKRFKETISSVLRVKKISFYPFAFSLFSTFRDLTSTINDSTVIVDIDGETTEITLVERDSLLENFSFPVGTNSLVRKVATEMGTVKEEAYSSLKMLAAGKRNMALVDKLPQVVERELSFWTAKFFRSIDESLDHFLPTNRLLVTGNPLLTPLYLERLRRPVAENLIIGDKNFEVNYFQDKVVSEICEFDVSKKPTTRLMVEAIFSDKLSRLKKI